ncbi:DNA helicase UvrD [Dyadobacter sp.]|uniref:DNA helicase UvrD n=1 Tax=Dyadobacter sp. TaxID=1914288 RepID=UPI003F71CCD9
MDKKLILACAGSGKTYHIIEQLNDTDRFLILAYTINNIDCISKSIISKFGYLPANIKIKSFFNFLYSFCYKPYLSSDLKAKGIYWKLPPPQTYNLRRSNDSFYITKGRLLYHNRLSKLLVEKNTMALISKRLEKYYDCILVDEVQDFGGHDFNLLIDVAKSQIKMLMVGDFFQHTFNTSNDGQVNINLYQNFIKYKRIFDKAGVTLDDTTLINSRRCTKTVCDFVRENVGIEIYSQYARTSNIIVISTQSEADKVLMDSGITKLFSKEHYNYECVSENWGGCKGLEYENVCVILGDEALKLFNKGKLRELKPITKNKFYVACTRAKNDLYFLPSKFAKIYRKGVDKQA